MPGRTAAPWSCRALTPPLTRPALILPKPPVPPRVTLKALQGRHHFRRTARHLTLSTTCRKVSVHLSKSDGKLQTLWRVNKLALVRKGGSLDTVENRTWL